MSYHSSCCPSLCLWGGQKAHHTSASPPKPWWISSIYTLLHPVIHHSIHWKSSQEHNPNQIIVTAFQFQYPHFCHKHDSQYHHNFQSPSNAISNDHLLMAMFLSMTKFFLHRAPQNNYISLNTRPFTSTIGSSEPMTPKTIQWYTRNQSLKENC